MFPSGKRFFRSLIRVVDVKDDEVRVVVPGFNSTREGLFPAELITKKVKPNIQAGKKFFCQVHYPRDNSWPDFKGPIELEEVANE